LKVEFKTSFARDLRKLKDETIKGQVLEIIEHAEFAETLQQIDNLKKLRVGENHYRIKMGDYRIGLLLEEEVIIFVRFLHRKDIYRYFP
jgi:mRNA interferase RelE/StbE